MRKTLALVEENATANHALEAAVASAEREGAALVVLSVVSESEFDSRYGAVTDLPGRFGYSASQARAAAAAVAGRAAAAAVGDRNVPYVAVGGVGRPMDVLLRTAAVHGCDEIVVPDRPPRWFGLLGRFDRALAWRFDGTVTRVTAPEGDGRPLPRGSAVDAG